MDYINTWKGDDFSALLVSLMALLLALGSMYPKNEQSNGNQIFFSSWFNDKFTIDAIIIIISMIIWHEYLTRDFSNQLHMSPLQSCT